MTPTGTMQDAQADEGVVLLARQPIYRRDGQLFGYELLQRVTHGETWDSDDDLVTLKVIRKAIFDFGINGLAGNGRVFLNMGRRGFADDDYTPFPPDRTVLEVLERVEVDDGLITDVLRARSLAYMVALDDYVGEARFDPLLPHVDIIKLDVMEMTTDVVEDTLLRLARLAPQAELLAEKVETEEHFDELRKLPIELYQGYYFKKPTTLEARTATPNQAALLRLAAELNADDVEFERLAALTSTVPKLAFDLLRITNSAATSLNRTVTSLHDAIIALGLNQLRKIVYILLATSNADAPAELGTLGLVRARLCATLATRDGNDADAAFTVGLFSIMDLALRRPLPDILGELDLHRDITAALLEQRGVLAHYLAIALEAETDDAAETNAPADAALEAIAWAEHLTAELAR